MKRKILALAGAAVAAVSIYGAAASLNISAVTLGEGSSAVAACNGNTTIDVTFQHTLDPTYGLVLYSVTLDHIAAACDGKDATLYLGDSGNNILTTQSQTVVAPVDDSTVVMPIEDVVHESDVAFVHIVIDG